LVVASLSVTWVATRAAGYTAFSLLTASVALGLLLSSPLRSSRWPRFATTELHRFVTLLTLVFIAVHVLVALLDSFIGFSLSDVLVPFTSKYRPVWTGLGIVSAYLAAALWATNWLQRRIGYHWWRRLHFGTFGVYVGATAHGIGSGSDSGWAWSWIIYATSLGLVSGLLVVRLPARDNQRRAQSRPRTAAANGAAPAGAGGTAQANGAATVGAAAASVGDAAATVGAASGGPVSGIGLVAVSGFSARIQGRWWQVPDGDGGAIVQLEGALYAGFDGDFQLRVHGWVPAGSSQLQVTDNRLWLRNRGGSVWWGRIDVFDGVHLRGEITADRPMARPLALEIELSRFAGEAISGALRATPVTAPSWPPASTPAG
jgi:sulfoxide reductase heme-binding subunit YedZ